MAPDLRRRSLLTAGLVAGGTALTLGAGSRAATAAPGHPTGAPPADATGSWYGQHRAPLRPVPFQKLPPGSITPRGWLRGMLDLQLDGLNGRYEEVSDYLDYDTCGWVHPSLYGWEELPYWLRGFGDLGYVTGDGRVLERTRTWIEAILATQTDDGWFGPTALRTSLSGGPDFWPGMPLLAALRSFAEYTGDERIVPFMTRYFAFQHRQPAAVFNRGWGAYRWGDNIDSVYWLYDRTGEDWLLELATAMHQGSQDYTSGIPTWHNVNLAQGFREPLQYWLLAGDQKYREATYRDYATVMDRYGQFPGGGFAGDENCRPGFGDPRQGFETCGIVEFMHSFEMLTRFTGDPVWADRCEELAFNMLPAALDPQQKVLHYITSANSIQLDRTVKHGQFQNGFAMQAMMPGVHNYRCCPHNYGMGWPYLAEETWLATADGGLCASLYAASQVRARVGDGTTVRWDESTDYPFDDTITLRTHAPRSVRYPLYLRVPGWCERPEPRVNGRAVPTSRDTRYLRLDRDWRDGDTVTLRLPMRTTTHTWTTNNDAVSVRRGPLTFSLRIDERWERTGGTPRWPEYEVFPASEWNYALQSTAGFRLSRRPGPLPANPFTQDTTPLRLRGTVRRLPAWHADSEQVVGLLQPGPARVDTTPETATLVPMGAARLRITAFPGVGHGPGAHDWHNPPLITASHCFDWDSLEAVGDGREPTSSADTGIPRLTFWDHRGSSEWVQYEFAAPVTVDAASIYWYDDTGTGACRVPAAWRLRYRDSSGAWQPVDSSTGYPTATDRYNTVRFTAVTTTTLRAEIDLAPGFSAGILEWTLAHA